MADVDDDFAWALDPAVVMFCVTCVRGMTDVQLLHAVGADSSGAVHGDAATVDSLGIDRDALGVRVAAMHGWAILIEFRSLKGADAQWVTSLSRGNGEAVAIFQTGSGMGGFSFSLDGELVTAFEPAIPGIRTGSAPDRLVDDMRAVSLLPEGSDAGVDPAIATLHLVHRLTGIRLTEELVRAASWPSGFLPRRRRRQPA
ncbi:DUF6461 domain-containing protein [Amycolatopsis sp. NPDC003861]